MLNRNLNQRCDNKENRQTDFLSLFNVLMDANVSSDGGMATFPQLHLCSC